MRALRRMLVGGVGLALVASSVAGAGPAEAVGAQITASGSSWSANLVNQNVADVTSLGLQVVYTSTGSAAGRADFRNAAVDFAVTDSPFQGVDPIAGNDTNCTDPAVVSTCRSFVYAPMAGGAIVLIYHLTIPGGGELRLSPATTARIFDGSIQWWDDAALRADNPGLHLPHTAVVPVVHNEGSAASRVLTSFLARRAPAQWTSGPTAYFPKPANGIGQSGSDGVANYVTSAFAEGSIGYDEVSYALAKGVDVAEMLNAGGYYAPPTAGGSALALRSAGVAADGAALLDPVFDASDPRVYPLSYYSYSLVPTSSLDPRMTTAKRTTLAQFLYYSACQGQTNATPLGYTPLPVNLVAQDMAAIAALGAADPSLSTTGLTLSTCNSPTFLASTGQSILESHVPPARACDRAGTGNQCDVAPSAPRAPSARAGTGRAVVSWRAPSVTGGLPVAYLVSASPGGRSCATTRLTCTITGLVNGRSYRFTVRAANSIDIGPRSTSSNAVVPRPAASAPRRLAATYPGRGRATVTWTAPASTGRLPVLGYVVRWSSNGGRTWTAWAPTAGRSATRGSLARRHGYVVQVRALTAVGPGGAATLRFTQPR